jgi:MerR family mercuric resistance operon transcriptional regulator
MRQVTASRAKGAMPIGELSRQAGVKIETIRFYERIKMLPEPARTEGGHRLYGPDEARILGFIRRARELGFTLDAVRVLLRLAQPGQASCREVRDIASHHLHDVRGKLADLRQLERLLAGTVSRCTGNEAPDCPVLDFLNGERPGGRKSRDRPNDPPAKKRKQQGRR